MYNFAKIFLEDLCNLLEQKKPRNYLKEIEINYFIIIKYIFISLYSKNMFIIRNLLLQIITRNVLIKC